ncbi:MAG: hypothetical protein JWP58_2302 [Hymenobacter sp.]|nr:hypothetical protein [Hymenobacter sp.]
MNLRILLLIGLAVSLSQCTSHPEPKTNNFKPTDKAIGIKIPDSWIEKLRTNKYQANSPCNVAILKEFEGYIKPDTLDGTSELVHRSGGILDYEEPGGRLSAVFVNLDEDVEEEVVGVFGYSRRDPCLGVFKRIDGAWYLIYMEPFFLFKESPELQIANSYSPNKVFYIRELHQRGSEVYSDAYKFYKLIDGKVYNCLELVNEASIYGWGLTLNQKVSSKFSFNSTTADELWVSYRYNFFAGAVEKGDMPWHAHEDIAFVNGEQGITYDWNKATHMYQPYPDTIPDGLDSIRLTKDKIACFGNFNNDTLFVRAFGNEIHNILKEGSKRQKKYLQKYLNDIRVKKQSFTSSGELEEKKRAGGTVFYGPSKY